MECSGGQSKAVPLLDKPAGASAAQTLGNIIVSVVGTGVLGLPFALRIAGWLAGSLGVIIAGLGTYYCMLLLVSFFGSFSFSSVFPSCFNLFFLV